MNIVTDFEAVTCCYEDCGITWAMPTWFVKTLRNNPKKYWHCPHGHEQHFLAGASDEEKLRKESARAQHLEDQLLAAGAEAERMRVQLLRDRQRFANGVCPCCNRSFENVRRHMTTQHPDYDVTQIQALKFKCSCGSAFDTLRGLRTHQGRQRKQGWALPSTPAWRAHLTLTGAKA